MKKKNLLTVFLLLPLTCCFAALDAKITMSYIESYKELAIAEMYRTGIPASIKLGQALLESRSGLSELSQKSNNHFGIKCKDEWTGEKYYHLDDDKDASGKLIESCFRVYGSIEESYIDHSEFLTKRKYYAPLFNLGLDYKKWAKGLRECKYATDSLYAEKLIRIIEEFQLYQYDQMPASPEPHPEVSFDLPKVEKPIRQKEDEQRQWGTKLDDWFSADRVVPATVAENELEEPATVAFQENQSSKIQPNRMDIFACPGMSDLFQSLTHKPIIQKPDRR